MATEARLQAANTGLLLIRIDQELAPTLRQQHDWVSLSQGQLIWRRFRRSRMAIVGMALLIVYTWALFCEFFSPYLLNTRFTDNIFQPPTLPRWVDAEGQFHLRPFIYYDRKVNRETLEMTYTADTSKPYPIYFFVKGEPYKLWGLIPSNIGTCLASATEQVPIFIIGSDRQGRDMFTRCLYGSRVSLTIGLIGVFLTIVFGSILGVASGYYGGPIDDFVQRFSELLMSIPQIPLWMALAAVAARHLVGDQGLFWDHHHPIPFNWGGLAAAGAWQDAVAA